MFCCVLELSVKLILPFVASNTHAVLGVTVITIITVWDVEILSEKETLLPYTYFL